MKKLLVGLHLVIVFMIANPSYGLSQINNVSEFYQNRDVDAELWLNGKIIDLPNFKIDQPQNKIAVLYSHGTSNSFHGTGCRASPKPEQWPKVMSFLKTKAIGNKKFLIFYLCSHSSEDNQTLGTLHKKRAEEIALAVKFITARGIQSEHIVIAGQSWGGWSSLYYAAKYKPKTLAILTFAPGIFGQHWYQSEQFSIIEEDIELFKKTNIEGLLFSHPRDYFFPTDPYHKFVSDVDGLTLVPDIHCSNVSDFWRHAYMFQKCSEKYNEFIFQYIKGRLQK